MAKDVKTIEVPAREDLTTAEVGFGFKVGQRVEFVEDFADDVPAGHPATISRIDNHPVHPITVDVSFAEGGMRFGCPVKPSEIRALGETPEPEPSAPVEPTPTLEGGATADVETVDTVVDLVAA